MNIAIIGGGITGLTAAYELSKNGHTVTVYEKEETLGGLASGFRPASTRGESTRGGPASPAGGWDWSLEKSYHHFFTNDKACIGLVKELGLSGKLITKRPVTANLLPTSFLSSSGLTRGSVRTSRAKTDSRFRGNDNNKIAQLDSPLHLLQFPGLSMTDKLRTGALVAFCKIYPFWQTLEGITAKQFFTNIGGKKAWEIIWEPLMTGKFSHYDNTIAASWLWARVRKRTSSLCYIEGGFATLVDALEQAITKNGGIINTKTAIDTIKYESGIMNQESWKKRNHNSHLPAGTALFTIHNSTFDKVLLTIPTSLTADLIHDSQFIIHNSALSIPHLHAQTLVLETDKPILKNVYWLSITDRSFPFLAVVAQTNFMDKKHYNGRHITYIGNYLPDNHPYLSMTKEQLLKLFLPFIKHINHDSKFIIHNSFLFTAPFAQPVHQLHYSKRAPPFETAIQNVYLANMDSIYPWDRGTNYAVELGRKAAEKILNPPHS
jgi:protoporphyrinogen oxidase